jgi:hypothetical protein
MTLQPRERVRMIRQMVAEIDDDREWSVTDLDILLQQFGLGTLELDNWASRTAEFARAVGEASDDALREVYAIVMAIEPDDVTAAVAVPSDHGLWQGGQLRLFLSHSALHKDFVGAISRELAVVGVHGFVAHDTMEVEKPWQSQIEIALRTAEAFVGLVHPAFNDSPWCQQEVGWAKGRGLPEYFVRIVANPVAFAAATQWPSGFDRSAKEIANDILSWLERSTSFSNVIVDGLIHSLREAGDYYSAEAAAKRIVALGGLTDAGWSSLAAAFWANDQVRGGVLPTRVLRPFFAEHDREWPPPNTVGQAG